MRFPIWPLALLLSAAAAPVAAAPIAPHHMIVAAEPDAAKAGLAMLRAGGSAVDAAIAAQLVLTLEEPQASGIGGGAYMMVSAADGVHAYDGREKAPASATPDLFLNAAGQPRGFRDVQYGGIAVGVPGDLAMLAMAHRAHGKLPWAKLFQPAIKLAQNGYAVPARLAQELAQFHDRLAAMPDMRALFFHPDGTTLRRGEIVRNPALAETFRRIAAKGPAAFYKGPLARQIADAVSNAPVNARPMTVADLAGMHAIARTPVCGIYRLYRVCGMPPSTSGGVTVLQILGLLQHFGSNQLQPGTLSAVHLISEAEKLAYADRNRWLGDPSFVTVPLKGLLDPNYLAMRAKLIDPTRSMGRAKAGMPPLPKAGLNYAPMPNQPSFGTSQLAVVDDSGEAVSMTMSVQAAFGSALTAGGFILNNELTDFSFRPVIDGRPVANAPAGDKRPLSAMSPVLVFAPDGTFYAALGSPGGRQIIAYVAQALVNLIDGHESMPAVAAQPRHVDLNGPIQLERGTVLEKRVPALEAMGHTVRLRRFVSGINGIRRVTGGYEGGADPRREGVALGD